MALEGSRSPVRVRLRSMDCAICWSHPERNGKNGWAMARSIHTVRNQGVKERHGPRTPQINAEPDPSDAVATDRSRAARQDRLGLPAGVHDDGRRAPADAR